MQRVRYTAELGLYTVGVRVLNLQGFIQQLAMHVRT